MPPAVSSTIDDLLHDVADQLHPDDGDFVGRDWIRKAIQDFLAVRNRMLVLVGPPGVGKTAFAAALVREQAGAEQPYLAHFCGLSGGDNPYTFCSGLAQQLHDRLGDAYTLPQTARGQQVTVQASVNVGQTSGEAHITALELKIGGMHPREAFRQVVREPLRAYDAAHAERRAAAPLIVVIDALDRAWDWDAGQGGNIVSLLADVQDLPPWVNLICTARPGPAVQALRAQAGVQVFEIDAQSAKNLADVETFFRDRFLGALEPEPRALFDSLLAASPFGRASNGGDPVAAFVRQAVAASQGSFLFVRRYVDAWRSALRPGAAPPGAGADALLRFDVGGSLADTLDTTYAAISAQIRPSLDANRGDADEDVLAALAIAFAPLSLPLLASFTRQSPDAILDSVGRLAPVIERGSADGGVTTYAFYHRGFTEYMRRQLPLGGRTWDVRAAQALEQIDDGNPLMRDYSANYRWSHLLRGLDLAESARDAAPAPGAEGAVAVPPDWLNGIAEVQAQVRDAVTQAQLLRGLAARALDPAESDATGSWAAALNCLKAAEKTLRRSRALVSMDARGGRMAGAGPVAPELIELERTLIATGDAYATIAQRMGAGVQRPRHSRGIAGRVLMLWDIVARLPMTIYLLLVLAAHGVREIHIPGALQNLARAQDWTVARLCVLSVSAYRRARRYAYERGAADVTDDVAERLAALYYQMGAYDAAAAAYAVLLAHPVAIERPWRQAVWRLELGEVLLARGKPDRAVEVLTGALPMFIAQQAPIQRARALTALAAAHDLQAIEAIRNDPSQVDTYSDLAIANCRDALAAWGSVTTLQGDESASVDPALAISFIGHQLWNANRNPRLGDEQQRAARSLLDTIAERHYLQRFEHPLLRLFRVAAVMLLPAFVLTGLLLAVQRPSSVQVRIHTELAFQPPLLDLTHFPNNFISGQKVSPDTLTAGDLAQLTASDSTLKFLPSAPALDPRAISSIVLLWVAVYLVCYTLFGLAVIAFSSPAQFQNRRPGRLILRKESLVWHGPVGQRSLLEAWDWLWQDARALWEQLWGRVRRAMGYRVPPPAEAPAPPDSTLTLADVGNLIAVDRRAFGNLLYDFSLMLVQPLNRARPTLAIPGTVMHYEELCDELERRINVRRRPFGVDVVRSFGGFFFTLTLLYALALLVLLPRAPGLLSVPLPGLGYSLSNLYVLAAPGLLLPLLWWFVAQPLGASSARHSSLLPLVGTALVGLALTGVVLAGLVSLTLFGLKPDLATPVVAGGLLAALVYYAPARPLRRMFVLDRSRLFRAGLMLLGLAGLVLLALNVGTTLLWYDALVRGNKLVAQALATDCASKGGCTVPIEAIQYYDRVICLRSGDSDGYAFRGFARLARKEYDLARADFAAALRVGQSDAPLPPSECAPSAPAMLTEEQRASLHANLGAVDTLLARDLLMEQHRPLAEAEARYEQALCSYALALGLPVPGDCAAEAVAAAPPDTETLDCYPLMSKVLVPDDASEPGGLPDLLVPGVEVSPGQAPIVLQLADACYSRGFARSRAPAAAGQDQDTLRRNAWNDLAAAAAGYMAVVDTGPTTQDRELAQHGRALTWLELGQFESLPRAPLAQGSYDRRTALLRALNAYRSLEQARSSDLDVFAGLAWSAIQLGAWDTAREPLERAAALAPDDPTYPALQGLVAWLDSTQYPLPRKGAPSPRYASAISQAIDFYTRVIATGKGDLSRAYATRSILFFSLRNSPRGTTYADEDYGAWMRRAIADMDQALNEAERTHQPGADQVGYRYWRGRLNFALAVTLQEKFRGPYDWTELVPLYSRAFDDFSTGIADDKNRDRSKVYKETWLPWSRVVLVNATHMQLAQVFARRGNFARARDELELVDPRAEAVKQWDSGTLSAPRPDYSFLHGLISLGLGAEATPRNPALFDITDIEFHDPPVSDSSDVEFRNPLVSDSAAAAAPTYAEASYTQAISETEDADIVAQPSASFPDDARPLVYRAALADLDRLLASPPKGWPASARATTGRVRARLQARLDAITRP